MTGRHTFRRNPDNVDLQTILGFRPSPVFPTQPIVRDGLQALTIWLFAVCLPILGLLAFVVWLVWPLYG